MAHLGLSTLRFFQVDRVMINGLNVGEKVHEISFDLGLYGGVGRVCAHQLDPQPTLE